MNKHDLTVLIARLSRRSRASAADAVDNLVYEILKQLKEQPAPAKVDVKKTVDTLPSAAKMEKV